MARSLCWLLIVLLLGAFGAVVYVLLQDRVAAGRGLPAYSVYSDAADGLGEAAHLLRQTGWTPVAITRPIQHTHHRGLLVVVEPNPTGLLSDEEGSISEGDARALVRWVEEGNTLLLCGRKTTALHRRLGIVVTEDNRESGEVFTPVDLGAGGGYTEGIERLSVGSESSLKVPARALPLWWVKDRPGAALLRLGEGRVLVVADADFLTRRGLVRVTHGQRALRDDNLVFLLNAAGLDARDGKVYFDEYHHGIQAASGFWGYLAYHEQRWALAPILVVVGVAAWTWAVRLGPAVPTPPPASADAVDYASALGRLYQQAGTRHLLARVLVRDFLTGLTRHLHLRRTSLPAVILAAWRQQHGAGPQAERLQALLRGLAELRKGDLGDRELLAWAQAFDRFLVDLRGEERKQKTEKRQ